VYRCAILDDYQNVALKMADWTALAGEIEIVVFNDFLPDREARVAALRDFDVVVVIRERTAFDAELIRALPKLRLLVTAGMRNAVIDMSACEAQGITVCGTGTVAGGTAELAWGLMLALTRNLAAEFREFREGSKWQQHLSRDMAGQRLGVIGLGRLGARVARIGLAFDMDVVAWSRNLTEERTKEVGVIRMPSLEELLKTSDFVTIHIPLNNGSRGMIGADQLALMKPTSFLINTSRGPIIDEAALVDALERKRIAGAGLDVFSTEPLPADHRLRKLGNLVATPHIGYVTEANYRVFYRDIVDDIAGWLKGEPRREIAARK
jgi:D-3-phosphoglycerate dehydrogenase